MSSINLTVPYGDMDERGLIVEENKDNPIIAEHRNQDGSGELTFLTVATKPEVNELREKLAVQDRNLKEMQETINFLLGL
ncbi:hypothetical protein J31TS4_15790 [Paenibacillus sp. J31TS4]|uniref:hypothetical protein n=1 Tax=Paenibacillus sp. J31TS4 TaxID=2807195 RepID=UPI001B181BA7|nr:hypothetical protein [Paenibacillus sp. J31TS4]GIP38299.1 hypothetical protein J31TS4_15790 [Paenibacillus sp. J31TS4]